MDWLDAQCLYRTCELSQLSFPLRLFTLNILCLSE
jgi:hypothetical protein